MIYEHTPFSMEGNYLDALDRFMMMIKKTDWAIIRDHDVMFCGVDWYEKIYDAIRKHGEGSIYTCWTNRVKCSWQVDDLAPIGNDMGEHRDHDFYRPERPVKDCTGKDLMSGFLMVMSGGQWRTIRKKLSSELLGLDNEIHEAAQDAGYKILRIDLYVYHWYRDGIVNDKSHLKGIKWQQQKD